MDNNLQISLSELIEINSMNSSNHSELQDKYMRIFSNCQQLDGIQQIPALKDFANAILKNSLSSVFAVKLLNKVCEELYNFDRKGGKQFALQSIC